MSESLRRQISSPGALFAFESTARLGSFGAAALEMNVTQPSVSYQIKNLEQHLGVRLFERHGRSISLTEDGESLYHAVVRGFSEIQLGLAEISHRANSNLITLCISSSGAAHLLLPRYPKMTAALPELELSVKIMNRDINPAAENADFAVRLGSGDWDGLQSWRLFDEVYFPLCAPTFFEGEPSEVTLGDLQKRNLLFLKERHRPRDDWHVFFQKAGAPVKQFHARMTFSDQQTLLQAALSGQGVGLGWLGMADYFVEDGSLVKVTSVQIRTDRAFYLVAPEGVKLSPMSVRFRDWFIAQGQEIQTRWLKESQEQN